MMVAATILEEQDQVNDVDDVEDNKWLEYIDIPA